LATKATGRKNVVVVDGCRLPFTMAGTVYGKYLAVDLGRMALKGLLTKTALSPEMIDYLYYGTVIQETRTSNIAREAAMGAGIPFSVPSHTISMACISSNQCITTGAEKVHALFANNFSLCVSSLVENFNSPFPAPPNSLSYTLLPIFARLWRVWQTLW